MATSRKHGWLSRKIFRRRQAARRKTPYGCRLGFEALESRRLLAIGWTNRGGPGNDSDGFGSVFGANAEVARNTAQGAIDLWQRVITNFNQSGGVNQLDVSINMSPTGTGFGGSGGPTTLIGNKPRTGAISLARGNDGPDIDVDIDGDGDPDPVGDGVDWFLDPTPLDNSEYNNGAIINPFAALPNPGSGIVADFMTIVTVEMAHVLGVSNTAGLAWRNNPFVTNTNQADVRDAPGTLWTFDGPTISGLLTSNNGGGGGTDTGLPVHVAYTPNQYFGPTKAYFGVADVGNAGGDAAIRYLPSKLMVHMLGDVYGYTITEPAEFGTFHAMLQADGELRIRGGLPAGLNFPSSDLINVFASGANINVDMDFGNDVAGTGISGNMHSGFLTSLVTSIRIDGGDGDDAIIVSPLQSNIPVTVDGGSGVDTLEVGGSPGNDTLTATSFSLSSTFVNITSYSAELVAWKPGLGIADFFAPSAILSPIRIDMTTGGSAVNVQSLAPFSNLTINGSTGNDTITVGASPFASEVILSPVTVNGGDGNDTLFLGSNNGDSIDANVTFNGGASVGGVGDRIIFNDTAPSYNVSYNIAPTSVTRDGFNLPRTVSYSSTEGIVIDAGSGADTVTLLNAVGPLVTANGNSGNDNFIVGGGNMTGFVPQIFNGGLGIDQITFDDRFDPTNRIWDMRNNEVIFGGLISLFTDGFESVGLLAGTGNDEITFAGTLNQAFDIDAGGGSDVFILGFQSGVLFNFGATSLRGGDASDAFTINDASVGGGTTLALDGGNALNSMAVNESFPVGFTLGVGYFVSEGNGRFDLANIETQVYNGNANNNIYTILSAGSLLGTITVNGNLGNDTFLVAPQPLGYTFKNLSLNGNQGTDTFTYDASALSNDEGYNVGTNNIQIARGGIAEMITSSSMNQITLTGGSGNDCFAVDQYSAGIPVTVNGGFGDDTLDFGNGDVAANITNIAAFLFNGMEGIDTFNLRNANPANSFTYTAAANTTLQVSRTFPSSYFLSLEYYNTEQKVVYAGPAVDVMNITSFASGELSFHGGGGDDALNLPTSSDLLGRRVNFFGDAGTANRINQVANGKTTPSTLHVAQNTIGALPGDNFFAPGGSVFFDAVQIIQLRMGSGADTAYMQPDAVAAISIIGGNPTTAPGDTLNLALGGAVNYVVNGTPASGNVISDNLMTLTYSGFETGPNIDDVAPYIIAQSYDDSVVPTILVEFSEDVSAALQVSFLELINTMTAEQVSVGLMNLAYDLGTNIASFTFPGHLGGILPAGDYSAMILAGLPDLFGNQLAAPTPNLLFHAGPVLLGDYNQDSFVDAADYTVWQDTLGQVALTPYSGADGSGNGVIGPEDYDVWKSHFGETIEQGAGSGEQGVSAIASLAMPVAYVNQPPALPGVIVVEVLADGGGSGGGQSAFLLARYLGLMRGTKMETNPKPPAEPGAVGLVRALNFHRDDALLAWLSVAKDSGRDRFTAETEHFADRTGGASGTDFEGGLLAGIDAVFGLVGGGE